MPSMTCKIEVINNQTLVLIMFDNKIYFSDNQGHTYIPLHSKK
jgi:hypothetical protein